MRLVLYISNIQTLNVYRTHSAEEFNESILTLLLLTEQVDIAEMLHDLDLGSTGLKCIHVRDTSLGFVSSVPMYVLEKYFQTDLTTTTLLFHIIW
jgi:hypothetical protein